jgi:hypothetical protein
VAWSRHSGTDAQSGGVVCESSLAGGGGIDLRARRLSYQSAVESAIAQGVDLEVAIDLYRSRVVDAMRLYPTTSLEEERRVFGELCELFQTPSHSTQGLQFNPEARAGGMAE